MTHRQYLDGEYEPVENAIPRGFGNPEFQGREEDVGDYDEDVPGLEFRFVNNNDEVVVVSDMQLLFWGWLHHQFGHLIDHPSRLYRPEHRVSSFDRRR